MPFALQNRALFKGGKRGEKVPRERGGKGVASKEGKKEKRTRENRIEKRQRMMQLSSVHSINGFVRETSENDE